MKLEAQILKKKKIDKVLLFFGDDIKDNSKCILENAVKEKLILIALDSQAIIKAKKAEVPFTIIDDWVTEIDDHEARIHSSSLESNWFVDFKNHTTISGLCWPEIDQEAMFWFWRELMFAKVLSRSLRASGIKQIFLPASNLGLQYSLYYYPSKIVEHEFLFKWRENCKYFPPKVYQQINYYSGFRGKLRYLKQNTSTLLSDIYNEIKSFLNQIKYMIKPIHNFDLDKKIVFIINPHEINRIKHNVFSINDHYPDKTRIILLNANQNQYISAKKILPGKIYNLKIQENKSKYLVIKYKGIFKRCLKDSNHKILKNIFRAHQNHFRYYFEQRWPNLHFQYLYWKKLFSKSRPSLLILTSLPDAESQLPALASNFFKIKSFCLSHGIGVFRKLVLHTSYVLAQNKIDQASHIFSGREITDIKLCKDLGVINEYPTIKVDQYNKSNKKTKFLILTDGTGHSSSIFPARNRKYHSQGLYNIRSIMNIFNDSIDLKIKVHPKYHDKELIEAYTPELLDNVLPTNSNLEEALEWADCIIALNYLSVAIIHCFNAKKPVLLYLTIKNLPWASPYEYSHLLLDGCEVINNISALKLQIKSILEDPNILLNLSRKSSNFRKSFLSTNDSKELTEIVDSIVSNI